MRILLISGAFLLASQSFGQVNVRDSTAEGWMIHISSSYTLKAGDFSEYLNPNFTIGGDVQYKFQNNWAISVGGRYHFADGLKDPNAIFGDIITSRGQVLGLNGEYAPVTFRERGYNWSVDVTKIFSQWGHNANSGPALSFGAGYNAHWIDVRNQQENTPQIQDEYLRGYDHYTQGFMTRQFLGYHYAGNFSMINFNLGFEFMQGFNRNVRGYNYHTRATDSDQKLDFYYGIRATWFLPIYNQNAQKYFYY